MADSVFFFQEMRWRCLQHVLVFVLGWTTSTGANTESFGADSKTAFAKEFNDTLTAAFDGLYA